MFKLILKIIIYDYGFNFKFKRVVINYSFNFKIKTVIDVCIFYYFKKILNCSHQTYTINKGELVSSLATTPLYGVWSFVISHHFENLPFSFSFFFFSLSFFLVFSHQILPNAH